MGRRRHVSARHVARRIRTQAAVRATLSLAGLLAAGLAVLYIGRHRHETIDELVAAVPWPGATVVLLLALAFVARRAIAGAIAGGADSAAPDPGVLLARFGERLHATRTFHDVASAFVELVGANLGAAHASVLAQDAPAAAFAIVAGTPAEPLPASSVLANVALTTNRVVRVEAGHGRSVRPWLPPQDDAWIERHGLALLVPVAAPGAQRPALLAIGAREDRAPYSEAALRALEATAVSAGLALENRALAAMAGAQPTLARGDATLFARECETCGQVHSPYLRVCPCGGDCREAPLPLLLSDKFRIERRLGSGGMGIVYRATDVTLERTVAVKTLPNASGRWIGRLKREARAAAAVRHENLAQIFGVETWCGTPVLIVEHLEGGTLADRLRDGRLTSSAVATLGLALAEALTRLHEAGIIHRDIKPSNIGYTLAGVPKLLDFGLAHAMVAATDRPLEESGGDDEEIGRHLESHETTVITRGLLGTLPYVAPEALAGAPANPGFDLWSLGVVLYEALTGTNPFRGRIAAETRLRIVRGQRRPLDQLVPHAPRGLTSTIEALLSRSPSGRPPSAQRVRDELLLVVAAAPAVHQA